MAPPLLQVPYRYLSRIFNQLSSNQRPSSSGSRRQTLDDKSTSAVDPNISRSNSPETDTLVNCIPFTASIIETHLSPRRRRLQNKHTDGDGWNRIWERDISRIYDQSTDSNIHISLDRLPNTETFKLESKASIVCNWMIPSLSQKILALQRELVRAAIKALLHHDLENTWRRVFSWENRRDLVLEGLYHVSNSLGDDDAVTEGYRQWCPEVTVASLSNDTGGGAWDFIDLLRTFLHADLFQDLVEPIIIKNPTVDALMNKLNGEEDPMFLTMYQLERCYYLSLAMWCIINACYGISEEIRVARPLHLCSRREIKFMRKLRTSLVKDTASSVSQRGKKVVPHSVKQLNASCAFCTLSHQDSSALGFELNPCVRCIGIGRRIWYCGRDCQMEHWKAGHKDICGLHTIPPPAPPIPASKNPKCPFFRPTLGSQKYSTVDSSDSDVTLVVEGISSDVPPSPRKAPGKPTLSTSVNPLWKRPSQGSSICSYIPSEVCLSPVEEEIETICT